MNREQTFFLALLRDHLHGRVQATPPAEPDWDALHRIAQAQSLLGVCYVQLKALAGNGASIPDAVLERFHEDFHSEIYYAANRSAAMERLGEAFSREGIESLPFKGWAVKELWPVPMLRTMGDIDLLIRPEDRQRTDRLLLEMGYEKYVDNHAVWTYWEKDVTLEVHDHMFYEQLDPAVDLRAYFDRAWDYVGTPLWPSFHFVYLLAHMAKHTVNSGVGFRHFLDLAFAARQDLDPVWIEGELKRLGLLRYGRTCRALCRAWLEGTLPPELDRGFYEYVSEKVFRDGTFGLKNEQNKEAHAAKELSTAPGGYWIGVLRWILQKLFPPYEDMQLIGRYSFVDGRPWLLPAAWIYRWGYCLLRKGRHSAALLFQPLTRREKILRRQELIRDWGLIEKQEGE